MKTFAPTGTFASLCLILSIAAKFGWDVHSFDFVAAYLNSPIEERVWVKPPPGAVVPPGHALRLLKALYSTRQAARCWRLHLQKVLANLGYMASLYDASLYVLNTPDAAGLIWVHVNDGIVMGSSPAVLHQLELDLGGCLEIKWDRDLTSVVGINLVQCQSGFALRQEKLTRTIASCFWDGVLTATHPLPSSFEAVADPAGNPDDSRAYLQIVMTLSYLAVGTRPDIAYAVNRLARYSSAPGVAHWKALRHLVNFVVLFQELRLNLFPRNAEEPLQCFVDSSWGGGSTPSLRMESM